MAPSTNFLWQQGSRTSIPVPLHNLVIRRRALVHAQSPCTSCVSCSSNIVCDTTPNQCETQLQLPINLSKPSAYLSLPSLRIGSIQHKGNWFLPLACVFSVVLSASPASASEGEVLTGSALQVFKEFLEQIDALGPYGPAAFVFTVMFAEMIPLLPTQPLILASGLLFGAQKGAALVLLGVTLAAFNAFSISRGIGRPLAEKVIQAELGHSKDSTEVSPVSRKIMEVQEAIESGGLMKQLTAVVLLRLTPIVPFSASNYILGLTPIQLPAFVGGTVVGMSVWSLLYASLGGASRKLLERGEDLGVLLADLGEKAGGYTQAVAVSALSVGVLAALAYTARNMTSQTEKQTNTGAATPNNTSSSAKQDVRLEEERVRERVH